MNRCLTKFGEAYSFCLRLMVLVCVVVMTACLTYHVMTQDWSLDWPRMNVLSESEIEIIKINKEHIDRMNELGEQYRSAKDEGERERLLTEIQAEDERRKKDIIEYKRR